MDTACSGSYDLSVFNDANLIGAVYVHIKAREKKISMDKVNELMELLENRREGEYLKALLME